MNGKKISHRLRSAVIALLALVLAVALVLGVSHIPGHFTRFDMSTQDCYTLSPESEALLAELDEDVELLLFATEGSEDLTLQYLLQRYADLCERVSVRIVDPTAESELAAEYAEALRYNNSVTALCGERRCFVDFSEIYQSDYTAYYETGNTADILSVFRGEAAITGAIRYVTEEDLPHLYVLSGHEEMTLGESIQRQLRADCIVTEELDLSTADAVPADCSTLLIHAPSYDISAAEREKLAAYLADGGQMILITAYSGEPMPELAALMEEFGCALTEGLVVEQDRNHYIYGYYDCLLPAIAEHELTASIASEEAYVVMPGSQGILCEERTDVSVTPLLTTSAVAYASTDLSSVGKKDGDVSGPLTVGALIEKDDSRVIWYGSGFMLNESYQQSFGGANTELFLANVRDLCGSAAPEIPAKTKSVAGETLALTTAESVVMGAVITLAIPLVFVVTGAFILIRRRRRA